MESSRSGEKRARGPNIANGLFVASPASNGRATCEPTGENKVTALSRSSQENSSLFKRIIWNYICCMLKDLGANLRQQIGNFYWHQFIFSGLFSNSVDVVFWFWGRKSSSLGRAPKYIFLLLSSSFDRFLADPERER